MQRESATPQEPPPPAWAMRTWAVPLAGSLSSVRVLAAVGVALLLVSVLIATATGSARIDATDVAGILLDRLPLVHVDGSSTATQETILWEIRLPRVVAAALVGACLAVAGAILQGVFRNPLADPYLVGASSGAALAAVVGFLLFPQAGFFIFGFSWVPVMGFVGALAAVLVVYLVAYADGRVSVATLLLAGVALSAFLGAVQSFLMLTRADDGLQLSAVFSWLLGSVGTVGWDQFAILGPFLLVGLLAARLLAYPLNALALGEEHAGALGIPVERVKLALIAVSALLTAAAVASAGLVAFVGLVVPHVMRLLAGPDHRHLLWLSALYGASFVVLTDLVARTLLSPQEIPLGVITGLVGGPFFILLLRRSRGRYEF